MFYIVLSRNFEMLEFVCNVMFEQKFAIIVCVCTLNDEHTFFQQQNVCVYAIKFHHYYLLQRSMLLPYLHLCFIITLFLSIISHYVPFILSVLGVSVHSNKTELHFTLFTNIARTHARTHARTCMWLWHVQHTLDVPFLALALTRTQTHTVPPLGSVTVTETHFISLD